MVSFRHKYWSTVISVAIVYTLIWSLVNFPSGVLPFGTESGKYIDQYDDQGDFALKLSKKVINYKNKN